MTGQLAAQRTELMDAYSQIDERRRFTETVLAGVSAGVIGLDAQGRIELPNRTADELLGLDLLAATGHPLAEIVPEFAALFAEVAAQPDKARTAEIQIGPHNHRRILLVRIGAELSGGRTDGFVVTFDDITELQSAQRKAAWADVARRIAHEIKNPLTPIQLSAERLKRRFTKEIQSDPDTFSQCADTIIRHVGDIGRMVDEFSAFARMPQPVIKPEDVGRIAREALVLQKTARPGIDWITDIPERGPVVPCDRRMLRQALTNLLQNAADAVACAEWRRAHRADACEICRMEAADHRRRRWHRPAAGRSRPADRTLCNAQAEGNRVGTGDREEDHGRPWRRSDARRQPDGPGAVASLLLPRSSSRAAGAAAIAGLAATNDSRCRMAHEILIVDDEPDIRLLIEGILRDEGYETRAAGDADAAIAAFRARRPSLVILDVWLQGSRMDGIGILETLQQRGTACAGGDDLRPRHDRDGGRRDPARRLRFH